MSNRPLIGLCAALENAAWGVWELPADLLPRMYVEAVQRAGGAAILLPVDPGWIEDPDSALDRLDGLIVAGGADLDPGSYGAERHPATVNTLPTRDRCEVALVRAALRRDMPLLGICRGMQAINVAAGGTLLQHVPEIAGTDEHMRTPGSFEDADHAVCITPGSVTERATGSGEVIVKSHHHQAIERLGEGLEITGRAVADDLPEAIEAIGSCFAIGVQWHPEAANDDRVIPALVAAARARSSA